MKVRCPTSPALGCGFTSFPWDDKKRTIRIGITLNAEIHPEWFDLLSKVTSELVRAEIVRAHLSLPTERYLSKFSNSPVILEPLRKTFPKVSFPNPPILQNTVESDSVELETLTVSDSLSPELLIVNSSFSQTPNVNSSKKTTGQAGSFESTVGENK